MLKENRFIKYAWQIIVTIKDAMLINNSLPNNILTKTIEITNYFCNKILLKSKIYNKFVLQKT